MDLMENDKIGGIVINPEFENFFVSTEMINDICNLIPEFNSYWDSPADLSRDELNELYNIDSSKIDSFLDTYTGSGLKFLIQELSKSVMFTYIATKNDLSSYIDGNIIKTSLVHSNGIFTAFEEDVEGCYIFTSPKYFKESQAFHEKQGWKLFAIPTNYELMAKYIIELDLDALVVNPHYQNIVIQREDLLKNLDLIVRECGRNIENFNDDYSFALTDAGNTPNNNLVNKGYDVKVRLDDLRPLTWRDIIIPADITFEELDKILMTLWGFNAIHLSAFRVKEEKALIMDKEKDDIIDAKYDTKTTMISQMFDKYDKIGYWYDFGDDWTFTIEIKKKIDYDKDYVTIKRYKGDYNPIEDCGGVYSLADIIFEAEHKSEDDDFDDDSFVNYLEKFDMDYTQELLKNKNYVVNPFF